MTNTPSRLQHQPKVLATYHQLLDIINVLEVDEKLPTTVALRARLGVSLETLNLALRELEQQHLIYSVRGVGIYVSPRRRTCLLVDPLLFHSQNVSPFWQLLVDLAREHAAAKNEDFTFHYAHPVGFKGEILPFEVQQQIESGQIQGVLGIGISGEVSSWIEERIPLVVFAAYGKYLVSLSAAALILDAADELARRGCRDIGFWRPHHPYRDGQDSRDSRDEEVDVFRDALHHLKLEFTPSLTHSRSSVLFNDATMSHQEQGYLVAREVFSQKGNRLPDGILIGDDMMTLGVLKALGEMGVKVGEDVLIASHTNKGAGVLPAHADLLVFEFDPNEIVHAMFSILNGLLQGQMPYSRATEILAKMRTQTSTEALQKVNV